MSKFLGTLRIPAIDTAPDSPDSGQFYFNTVDKLSYYYNGSAWIATGNILGQQQPGVFGASDLMVTQKGAGTDLNIAISSGHGLVASSSGSLISINIVATTTVTVTKAHTTLPRIDSVFMNSAGVISVSAGIATTGATLNNAFDGSHGGVATPVGSLRLADIYVAASASVLTNATIRDRRMWARGANFIGKRTAGAVATSGPTAEVDTTNLKARIECSGVPLNISFQGLCDVPSGGDIYLNIFIDGVRATAGYLSHSNSSGSTVNMAFTLPYTPTAGSHTFSLVAWSSGSGGYVNGDIVLPAWLTIREVIAQNAANNSVTTG